MAGPLKVYNLDQIGVVVDLSPIGNPPGTLIKAQNAIADPIGGIGTIRKRPGLKQFNAVAASGSVLGGAGIPLILGSAGPDFQNPFTDITIPPTDQTIPPVINQPFPTFDDFGFYYLWDWYFDFDEADEAFDYNFLERFDPDNFLFDVAADPTTGSSTGSRRAPILLPVNFILNTTGTDKYMWLNETMTSHISFPTNIANLIPNPGGIVVYPNLAMRSTSSYAFTFNNGAITVSFSGTPTAYLNNKVYYASALLNASPTISIYDAFSTKYAITSLSSSPNSATAAVQITSLLSANGVIYFTAWSSGTTTANTGVGRVYELDPILNTVRQLGSVFPTDQIPHSLTFAYSKLWVGTASNNSSAKVYSMRPDAVFESTGEDWVLDTTFAAGEGIVADMATFQGQIYAALGNRTLGPGSVRLMVRSTAGVWSASDTGTLDTNAGHLNYRGYIHLAVWPPENGFVTSPTPTLYATRNGATEDGTGNVGVRQLSGGVWSTVTTLAASGGSGELKGVYGINSSNTLIPILTIVNGTGAANTHDGVTWTSRSAQLTINATAVFPSIFVQV